MYDNRCRSFATCHADRLLAGVLLLKGTSVFLLGHTHGPLSLTVGHPGVVTLLALQIVKVDATKGVSE